MEIATWYANPDRARIRHHPVRCLGTPLEVRQSREQDRSRAEDVKIGRDWKAQGGENDHAGQAAPDQDHQTVGRDWRARPEKSDRQ